MAHTGQSMFSRLFNMAEQRHHDRPMFIDLIKEILTEAFQSAVFDGLIEHVRDHVRRLIRRHLIRRRRVFYNSLHSRHSRQLVHRLVTEIKEEL